MELIFARSGNLKRVQELTAAFDSPPRYGKGLDWTGYTVHDAANTLLRYLIQLPEPVIPLYFYERFRNPLRSYQEQGVGPIRPFDAEAAIENYQGVITELPPISRQALLYLLDLLAVFASKSDSNKMSTAKLAACFQSSILAHPDHRLVATELRLSQDVLIFLVEYQDHFLIGMQGKAAHRRPRKIILLRADRIGTPTKPPENRYLLAGT